MENQKDLDWLDGVKAPTELEDMKGVVVTIHEPRLIDTKDYGKRKLIDFVVRGKEGDVIASEFLPTQFPILTPSSSIGRILKKYKCKTLKELLNKEVELVEGKQNTLKIKKE